MRTVEDLDVFHKAHALTLELYKVTGGFPVDERYGLTSQVRRAAVSINANLMEGASRIFPRVSSVREHIEGLGGRVEVFTTR